MRRPACIAAASPTFQDGLVGLEGAMRKGHPAVGHRLLHVHGLAAPRTRLTLTDNHRRADDALHLDPTRLGPCTRPLADGRERFERDGTVFFTP